jgi:G3E family GTPase
MPVHLFEEQIETQTVWFDVASASKTACSHSGGEPSSWLEVHHRRKEQPAHLSDQDMMRRNQQLELEQQESHQQPRNEDNHETSGCSPSSMELRKQFKQHNVTPQDILIQTNSLQKAMERQRAKGFLGSLWF